MQLIIVILHFFRLNFTIGCKFEQNPYRQGWKYWDGFLAMARTRTSTKTSSTNDCTPGLLTPAQSAVYTYDMLISLKKIAALHQESELISLINAAAAEAEALKRRVAA
jgi:hypothetical protein